MSSDPLPVPESSAKPRDDADYEAVHAVLTATVRGRRFLTEYVARHGRADTRKLAGIIANLEAAMRVGLASQASHAFVRILTELIPALEQISAELARDTNSAADVHFAVERIQDIAMALRQRDVEAALCDGLDAEIREVGDAIVRNEAAEARAHNAAAQLRELARRVADMTARAATVPTAGAEAARLNDTGHRPLTDVADKASVAEEAGRPPPEVEVLHAVPQTEARNAARDQGADLFESPSLPLPNPMEASDRALQAVAGSNADPTTRAGLHDPLAALQALSEEELIALFS